MKLLRMRDYNLFRINFKGHTVFAWPSEVEGHENSYCYACSRKVITSFGPEQLCDFKYDGDLIIQEHVGGKYFPRRLNYIYSERKFKSVWEKKIKEKMLSLKKEVHMINE